MSPPLAHHDRSAGDQDADRVWIISTSGERKLLGVDAHAQIALWAALLLGGEAGLAELAPGHRDASGRLRITRRCDPRTYPRADQPTGLADRALQLAAHDREVFCGPLARVAALPGSAGVTGGRVVWVDLDDVQALARLAGFSPRPCLIVSSGGSGGAHAYWRLTRRAPGRALEAANAILAERLEGDPAVKDRGRLMRLPGTLNGKSGRPCRLLMADLRPLRHDPETLVGRGFDLPPRPVRCDPAMRVGARKDALRDLDPPSYFHALCGEVVGEAGLVCCPLPDHEDRTPSCCVYPTAERGWWCFGCARGGRITTSRRCSSAGPGVVSCAASRSAAPAPSRASASASASEPDADGYGPARPACPDPRRRCGVAHSQAMEDRVNETITVPAERRTITYTAVLTPGEDGWICAQVLELPEAISQGRTLEQAKANLADALEAALAWRADEGESIPPPGQVTVTPLTVPAPHV